MSMGLVKCLWDLNIGKLCSQQINVTHLALIDEEL